MTAAVSKLLFFFIISHRQLVLPYFFCRDKKVLSDTRVYCGRFWAVLTSFGWALALEYLMRVFSSSSWSCKLFLCNRHICMRVVGVGVHDDADGGELIKSIIARLIL